MPIIAIAGCTGSNSDEAGSAGNRNRLEERRVDQGEDHGVEADAERKGGDDGEGEPAMGEDHAQGEAEVGGHEAGTEGASGWFRGANNFVTGAKAGCWSGAAGDD